MESTKPEIYLYTDGSCPKNPGGPGGWGFILRSKDGSLEHKQMGGAASTTNNIMEMMPVIEALKLLAIKPFKITLCSDSQYVVYGITKWRWKWKKNNWQTKDYESGEWVDVKNVDLWKQLDELLQQHEFVGDWVKGHAGHPENEMCDQMAEEARLLVESKLPPPPAVQK
jgi:ribonuclease HI